MKNDWKIIIIIAKALEKNEVIFSGGESSIDIESLRWSGQRRVGIDLVLRQVPRAGLSYS